MISKKIIYGCEGRGDAGIPYLTRYTLIQRKTWQLCLHVFHRSDHPDFHDHPWNFWTLVLWRGYIERLPGGKSRRIWPGMLLYRPATHAHWVQLHPIYDRNTQDRAKIGKRLGERTAVTLCLMGRRRRVWGFFTEGSWVTWYNYFIKKGCL
ncbi:hypothetical protein DYU11_11665 [Fibrisoma montanum]|uniref:Cupin domain-containing protein n=1 Tax=Fibrisoma montanum TaxID=2305895 RepID=A0A418MB74_9BACT|nr:hypothetical protein [Fibrisoma montanum]RIV23632.1 hypothetical protein DYU11_11665 [Fibrisoma montanum]